jgi:putative exosortase-associated protein (TIGR04073 family)
MHPLTRPLRSARPLALAAALTAAFLAAPSAARAANPATKFGRGLSNVALGVMEIPAQIMYEDRRNGPFYAASIGFARGIGYFVTRELVGVYEVVTFPAPIPRGYRAILRPEYPWQLFD